MPSARAQRGRVRRALRAKKGKLRVPSRRRRAREGFLRADSASARRWGHIQRLSQGYAEVAAEMKPVTVIQADGKDVGGSLGRAAEGHRGNAAVEGQEGVHGSVASFRVYPEGHVVFQHAVYLLQRGSVTGHFGLAIPVFPGEGQHLAEMEETGYPGIPEHIGPGAEGEGTFLQRERHQRIHQRAGMIGSDQPGAFLPVGKGSSYLRAPETATRTEIYVLPAQSVPYVFIPEFTHLTCSG